MSVSHANKVGAYDAKTHFSELLDRVELGEEITITKHGTPVARLVPVKKTFTAEERRSAIERIKKLGKGLSLGGLAVRDLIKTGRR
jgi:prevent-host-death family protein